MHICDLWHVLVKLSLDVDIIKHNILKVCSSLIYCY